MYLLISNQLTFRQSYTEMHTLMTGDVQVSELQAWALLSLSTSSTEAVYNEFVRK